MDHQPNIFSLHDLLYCHEEEEWGVHGEKDFSDSQRAANDVTEERDHISDDDEELLFLLSKEKEHRFSVSNSAIEIDSFLSVARREAVEWILKVNGYYGFSTLTAILAVNYLDRFVASVYFQKDKAWMIPLASVTSLSLAAKVEETYVPLLLDLQVESKGVFEAKAIMKMEVLMLSTLEWRMNIVTPISFIQHITIRFGFNNLLHLDFLPLCHRLLLSIITDLRVVRYEASVLATSIMVNVIHEIEPHNSKDYQNKLIHLCKICKMKVKDCCEVISEIISSEGRNDNGDINHHYIPSSPNGVIDGFLVSSDGFSNDSWAMESSLSSNHQPPLKKKIRIQEQQMRLPPLNRVFIEVLGSRH